jgi:ABC-2 type transport system permease protein
MRSFIQLYIATIREFRRDITALFWTLAFPVIFIVIFGIIFSNEGDISFSLGVVNEDGSAGQSLVEGFEQIDAFDVTTGGREDELAALEDGDRSAVIIIPAGTGDALGQYAAQVRASGSGADIDQAVLDVYYDAANQNTAQIVLNIVDKVVAGMNEGITGISPAMTVRTQQVTASDLRSIDYLLPGVIGMSLMQLGLMATAGPLVSLREKQVLRRMGATPLSKTTMLASQVLFRLTIAFVQTVVLLILGAVLFNVPVELSRLPAVAGIVLLGAAMFITLGYLLSGLVKTEEAVESVVSLPYFIFMFLSGIFFPIEMMPDWIRPLVDIIPLTYLGDALRKALLDAGSVFSMTTNLLVMTAWLVVCGVLAVRFFRWEPQG